MYIKQVKYERQNDTNTTKPTRTGINGNTIDPLGITKGRRLEQQLFGW